MKILVTTSSFAKQDAAALDLLRSQGFEVVGNPVGRKLTESEIRNLLSELRPLGIIAGLEPLTENVLQDSGFLKVISRCGAGLDNVDLKAASRLGIVVKSTASAPAASVAELTVGLVLAALRGIPQADASVREGRWQRSEGTLLRGKTVGILGCGKIGTLTARLLSGFDCEILGHDPFLESHSFCRLASLEEVLSAADVLCLHLPYSKKIHHFLGENELARLKKGALLVNAARGGLVDEEALLRNLESGRISAALDCFEEEPYAGKLRTLPNVVLTPHMGSYTKEGRAAMEREAAENLIEGLKEAGVLS